MDPFRSTYLEIDLERLRRNLLSIRKFLPPTVKLMAVVKADAYGHGSIEVAKAARKEFIDYLGVASLGEALTLRAALIDTPILILSESPYEHVERLVDANITQTVYSLELAQIISDTAIRRNKCAKIHVKIDTGMGRVGAKVEDASEMVKRIFGMSSLYVEGIYTHFANAYDRSNDFTDKQFIRFTSLINSLKSEGINISLVHAANSAAMINFPMTYLNMVRIGLCLYGLMPTENPSSLKGLEPVLSFKTKVNYLKEVESGFPISYGSIYSTKKKTKIATLPVGYADGLPRSLGNKGFVLINKRRYPIVGNITMDMTMVDVGTTSISVGDEVVIIGEQGTEKISTNEIAAIDGSISYEILCRIGKRVPRNYVG